MNPDPRFFQHKESLGLIKTPGDAVAGNLRRLDVVEKDRGGLAPKVYLFSHAFPDNDGSLAKAISLQMAN